jgi:hypothetical protein
MPPTANILKFGLYNRASDTKDWYDEIINVIPPVIASNSAHVNYTNIVANHEELLRDGDQNLPAFTAAGAQRYTFFFGDAVVPDFIAVINHNCHEAGDYIRILKGPGLALVEEISSPNRSVDIFRPLRMNDAWVNIGGDGEGIWHVVLSKPLGGTPYCGEIFFSFGRGYTEFETPAAWGVRTELDLKAAALDLENGEQFLAYTDSPRLKVSIPFGRQNATNDLREFFWAVNAAQRFTAARQVLVLQDRLCMFGRLQSDVNVNRTQHGGGESSRQTDLTFVGEFPRRFHGDAL